MRANPHPGSVDVEPRTVTIDFNELVNVKDAFTKVVVSPPSKQVPRVSSNGHRVTIQFQDTLLPNTTYTVDFGNAIEDVNEGNKLEGFTYMFSTGPELDSLRISGMVLDAATLEPQKEVMVGVHSVLADSAFTTTPFERIAKTDDRGRFIIMGLKPGPYRIFALKDMNNDNIWDNPDESIAFYDEIVVPQTETAVVTDTIYDLKSMRVDTIVDRVKTVYLPNDILLPLFNINFKQQYVVKSERPDSMRITLQMNAASPTIPFLTPLNIEAQEDWFDLERSVGNDTVTYWLRDPLLMAADTLKMRVNYTKVLRSGDIEEAADTISIVKPTPPKKKAPKKKKDDEEDEVPELNFVSLNFKSTSSLDVFAPVIIEAEHPLESLYADGIHLEQKVDTLWTTVPDFKGVSPPDSLSIRTYKIEYPWEYGASYRVRIDSLAATDIYGLKNKPLEQTINIKKQDDYSNLNMVVTGLNDTVPAFVELLNSSDSPVRKVSVEHGRAVFKDVAPGTYYARLTIDQNNNGLFDPGNYEKQIQPEIVFYYPKKITLRKNWTIDQTWNVYETPVDLQKPDAIKKNKPELGKHSKRNQQVEEEDEDDGYFDPTVNPFDPKSVQRSKNRARTTMSY